MFEYLMPLLVMPNYENTLLDQTCKGAVRQQIEYGRLRGVPWGVSESGYNRTDIHLNYQYRAFGVPGLGLKRGLAEDLVIAPYATAMALMVAPREACDNLDPSQAVIDPFRMLSIRSVGRRGLSAIDFRVALIADLKLSADISTCGFTSFGIFGNSTVGTFIVQEVMSATMVTTVLSSVSCRSPCGANLTISLSFPAGTRKWKASSNLPGRLVITVFAWSDAVTVILSFWTTTLKHSRAG